LGEGQRTGFHGETSGDGVTDSHDGGNVLFVIVFLHGENE
jgi:hypothetical protein